MLDKNTLVKWVNLNYKDFKLYMVNSNNSSKLAIFGSEEISEEIEQKLFELNFYKADNSFYLRDNSSITKKILKSAFKDVSLINIKYENILIDFISKKQIKQSSLIDNSIKKENKLQVPYKSASILGTPSAMIPINMAEPTTYALQKIEEKYGKVDDYISGLLKTDKENLKKILSPEQIDAIAIIISAIFKNREAILADQTGFGKGRICASIAAIASLLGKRVVFLTEKKNLFSDFYRDLKDIGYDNLFGEPFIVNSNAKIIDVVSDGKILYKSKPTSELKKIIKQKQVPNNYNLFILSYSQLNREGSPKTAFFEELVKDALVITDESHNVIGKDSNINKIIEKSLDSVWGSCRSSATSFKKITNLISYGKVLPKSLRNPETLLILEYVDNQVAEVLSQYLVEDGVMIRREHDLSEINMEVINDNDRKDRNKDLSDQLAPILYKMAKLSRLMNDEADNRNEENKMLLNNLSGNAKKESSENWYAANFGSKLSAITKQFSMIMSIDLCIERCKKALLNNEKPVIVVESTMESLIRELINDKEDFINEDEENNDNENNDSINKIGMKSPDFKSVLNVMLDRLLNLSVKKPGKDPEKFKVEDPFILNEADKIRNLINDFPDLYLSPIDEIKDQIEKIGEDLFINKKIKEKWVSGEISARNLRIRNGIYEQLQQPDRNETIVAFNNGGIDLLVITKAASTGLSLHASEKVKDKRRRRLIELQIPANVVERVQFWGRVNRRGQISVPAFETLCTGLPSQIRNLSMENKKIEKLSANVSANSENANSMDVPDLLNSIGNMIAKRIMEEQPSIPEKMCISMRVEEEQAEQELYFINKILQRLWLLSSEEQEKIFLSILSEYNTEINSLKAKGVTPKGNRELEGKWIEISKEIYEKESIEDGEVFGRPIELIKMYGEFEKRCLSSEYVLKHIIDCKKELINRTNKAAGPWFENEIKYLKSQKTRILNLALSGRLISVNSALAQKEDNAVKVADRKLTSLINFLNILHPGIDIMIPGEEEGENKNAVLTNIIPPLEKEEYHFPARWALKIAIPGEEFLKEISIATLIRDKNYIIPNYNSEIDIPDIKNLNIFDKYKNGITKEERYFLGGNLVRSAVIASEENAGSLVTYTDENNNKKRAILITKKGITALINRKNKTTDPNYAIEILNSNKCLWTNPRDKSSGIFIRPDNNSFLIEIPNGKLGKDIEKTGINDLFGPFRPIKNYKVSRIKTTDIIKLINFIIKSGFSLHHDSIQAEKAINLSKNSPFSFNNKKNKQSGMKI